jgi:hypothetical protein
MNVKEIGLLFCPNRKFVSRESAVVAIRREWHDSDDDVAVARRVNAVEPLVNEQRITDILAVDGFLANDAVVSESVRVAAGGCL